MALSLSRRRKETHPDRDEVVETDWPLAFDLGRISMPITMTMTNPARATEGEGSAHGYQAAKISHSQTARRIFSHLFSSTTVRKSLMSTIDLFKSSYRAVRQSRCSSIICISHLNGNVLLLQICLGFVLSTI